MFFADVVNGGPVPAMEKMLAFTQARHRMLAENVANLDTPHYQTKHLDAEGFQKSLRKAMDERKEARSSDFRIDATEQYRQDADGRLVVTPEIEPPENLLFHDRTNVRVEQQMAMLAENAMMHETVTELLRGRFEGTLKAIRGRLV